MWGGKIWQFLPLPKYPKKGKKRVQGEKEKTKLQMNLQQNDSKLLSQIQRINVTVIQNYIKQIINPSPDCPAKSLWSKQVWQPKGKTGKQYKDQKREENLLSTFLASHQITAFQLSIQLRFLNSQARASDIHILLGEQQQFQAKLSRTCQIWWWWWWWCMGQIFSILWII